MKKTHKNKFVGGFTIIELLVVIAIIGILATIILTSLSAARDRAGDAKTQAQLASLRAQAQLFYNENQTYGMANTIDPTVYTTVDDPVYQCGNIGGGSAGPLFADPAGIGLPDNLYTLIVNMPTGYKTFCYTNPSGGGMGDATGWAVTAERPTSLGKSWCVDSSGASKEYSSGTPSVDVANALCL